MAVFSTRPRVIDLFAGAGLFSHAFSEQGFDIIQAIEQDRLAAATYASNLGDHVEVADVRKVQPKGSCEVLIAGPPCQGFSTLGRRQVDDPRNALSFEVVKWARVCQPRIVVIENVEAFLATQVWTSLRRRLRRLGFGVQTFVLDASDFGVAQLRSRSFTIASRLGEVHIAQTKRKPVTVQQAFEGLPAQVDGKNHHYSPVPSALALARMKAIPPCGGRADILRKAPNLVPPSWLRMTRNEITDVWGRMRWDAPCNTLRTALQNPSKGRYIHPEENRVISLREAARLQSIPDRWQFAGTPYPIARQIGNGVPPLLGRAVAGGVLACLNAGI